MTTMRTRFPLASLLPVVVCFKLLGAIPVSALTTVDFERDAGGVPTNRDAAVNNTLALNHFFGNSKFSTNSELTIGDKTFWLAGGVYAEGLNNSTAQ